MLQRLSRPRVLTCVATTIGWSASKMKQRAARLRTMARGWRSLSPSKAKMYDSAAQVIERVANDEHAKPKTEKKRELSDNGAVSLS